MKKTTIDIVHKYEVEDYKIDKCANVKYLYLHINNVFPNHLDIVDAVLLDKYEWGGGKYVHLLSLESTPEQIGQKVRDIFEYKQGHLPGTSEEEQKKYSIIPNLK